jgi:hypothetical protein
LAATNLTYPIWPELLRSSRTKSLGNESTLWKDTRITVELLPEKNYITRITIQHRGLIYWQEHDFASMKIGPWEVIRTMIEAIDAQIAKNEKEFNVEGLTP